MECVACGCVVASERRDHTAQGYRRFRCRTCGRQFSERSDGVLNRTCLPGDIIGFVVFCRLRYRLTLRDLSEMDHGNDSRQKIIQRRGASGALAAVFRQSPSARP